MSSKKWIYTSDKNQEKCQLWSGDVSTCNLFHWFTIVMLLFISNCLINWLHWLYYSSYYFCMIFLLLEVFGVSVGSSALPMQPNLAQNMLSLALDRRHSNHIHYIITVHRFVVIAWFAYSVLCFMLQIMVFFFIFKKNIF